MPREVRGYEEDYRRSAVPSSRSSRPVDEPTGREDRHRAERGEQRERTRTLDDTPRAERPIRSDRERDRPDRGEDRMDYAVDPRIASARGDPRANTAVRREERETITAYRDPRTGQLRDAKTHELLDPSGRPAARPRDDYDDHMMMDRDDPPRRRERERERERDREPVYDSRGTTRDTPDDFGRGSAKPGYGMNEYFHEANGIEREVIQHDICRYLGNDATVRRHVSRDGREGYLVRAYRALTTAQLEDLRQDSSKYRRQRGSGRGAGIEDPGYTVLGLTLLGSYAEMRARDEPAYGDSMDVDMDYDMPPSRDRHRGEPEPRIETRDRHRMTPVTSGYGEPSYPAYALGTGQGPYSAAQVPRNAGNYSPQGGRATQPQYPPTTYDSRTSAAPIASIPPATQAYRDPRTGQLVPIEPGYGGGFAPEPARGGGRHGR